MKPEQLNDMTDSQVAENLLASMGDRLHVTMLKLTMVFGVFFSIINFFVGTKAEIILSLSLIPVCAFFLWLLNKGWHLASKVLSICSILLIISLVSVLVSPDVISPIFFIPIIMGMLVIFQGPHRRIGYLMAGLGIILLLVILLSDFTLMPVPYRSPDKILLDRVTNVSGTALICILIIYYVMQAGTKIQRLLIDRSERLKQGNQRLSSLVNSRESMMSILSHDLRSPLTLIVSTLDLLKPGRFPPDQLEGLVEKVSNRTKSTLLMLDSLLLWSRSQSDTGPLMKDRVFLKAVKQNLLDYCDLLAAEKKVNYQVDIPENGELPGVPAMLDTILRNLVSNAFKFTPAGGFIRVHAEKNADSWVFQVQDNGRGMKPEILQNLRKGIAFSSEGTNKEKGHGLGIQIVRDFLNRLEAEIDIQSEEGKGTVFTFRLPE